MQARDVMTADVVTVGPETTVEDIARRLLARRISAVPVVDDNGRLVGIVSEGDLLRRVETGTARRGAWWLSLLTGRRKLAEDYAKSHGRRAADIMTREVVTVGEEASLEEIVDTLETEGIKRVPVVRDGVLVGIVSRANLLHGLASAKPQPAAAASEDDRTIRRKLVALLRAEPWADLDRVNIVVTDGVVHFWGLANSQEQREAYRIAAEGLPGVRGVVNHSGIAETRVAWE